MKQWVWAFLAISAAMLLALSVQSADSEGASDDYVSQLDANSSAVYAEISNLSGSVDATQTISAEFPNVVLFLSEEEAKGYAASEANDAAAAVYLSDPFCIWLWDLPVKGIEVESEIASVTLTGDPTTYYAVRSVSFQISVQEKYADSVQKTLDSVKDALKTYSGSDSSKAKSIAKDLSGISKKDDEEGEISDLYDALVKRSSSSAGIAAAFTYVASNNGLEAVTVKGMFYGDSSDGKVAYWNECVADEKWYAVDVINGLTMVGSATPASGSAFASVYYEDLDLKDPNGLVPPSLEREGYPYPDDTPFYKKYGPVLTMAVISAIVVLALFVGVRQGNF
ncbi:MAG: hypothetical protein IKP20_06390 [Candidatus Methanomethylophilaceae archaeon]|nr:hypothetical protein [Candidatus Methanomethylophilaceae archaeon]